MVGTYLKRGEECRQGCARPHIATQGEIDTTHHKRSIDQSPHLGDVARTDNQQKIGREAVGQCRDKAHPGAHAKQQHCHPHCRHRKEEKRDRCIDNLHHLADRIFDGLSRILNVDKICRHTAKHTACPLGILARRGTQIDNILTHTLILLNVVLRKHLATKLRSAIDSRNYKKQEYSASREEPIFAFERINFHHNIIS